MALIIFSVEAIFSQQSSSFYILEGVGLPVDIELLGAVEAGTAATASSFFDLSGLDLITVVAFAFRSLADNFLEGGVGTIGIVLGIGVFLEINPVFANVIFFESNLAIKSLPSLIVASIELIR